MSSHRLQQWQISRYPLGGSGQTRLGDILHTVEAAGAAAVESGVHQQHFLKAVVGLRATGIVKDAASHLEITAATNDGVAGMTIVPFAFGSFPHIADHVQTSASADTA